MAHMQVIVDGRVTFEGDVGEVASLPTVGDMEPQTAKFIGSLPEWQVRLVILTAIVEAVRKALDSPVLKPIDVDIRTHGMGKVTMAIEMELPTS